MTNNEILENTIRLIHKRIDEIFENTKYIKSFDINISSDSIFDSAPVIKYDIEEYINWTELFRKE